MHYCLHIALLALSAVAVPALAQTPDADAAATPDPFLTALLDCHFGYAQQHHRSSASATEIAVAAASHCEPALQAAGLDTYRRALAAGLPVQSAEESQQKILAELRAMLPGFTLDKVIGFRAAEAGR